MPDTYTPSIETAEPPSGAGILEGYRSFGIGKLVLARSKSTAEIKKVVKDKSAKVESRKDGRSYSYAYADLADVMQAVNDALASQEMALFQTMLDRRGATILVTTLAHSSGEWISSEVRVSDPGAGPQVFGSSLTYMRRYSALAMLGIAPDGDDDGKAAQDRADQQARQRPAQRVDRPARIETPSTSQSPQRPSDESNEPVHTPIPKDRDGIPKIEAWSKRQGELLNTSPEWWRRGWLVLHQAELDAVREFKPAWADRLESLAVMPDKAEKPADAIADTAE